jgi:hypothetical protein
MVGDPRIEPTSFDRRISRPCARFAEARRNDDADVPHVTSKPRYVCSHADSEPDRDCPVRGAYVLLSPISI